MTKHRQHDDEDDDENDDHDDDDDDTTTTAITMIKCTQSLIRQAKTSQGITLEFRW